MPKRLILASASPRRKELLSCLGLPFEIMESGVAEDEPHDLRPQQLAQHLADAKVAALARDLFFDSGKDLVILGFDTLVVSDRSDPPLVLGKPASEEEARRMLGLLSGCVHTVVTGVSVEHWWWVREQDDYLTDGRTTSVETQVQFRELTPEIIDWYVGTGEPFDKAGGYGIQGHASAFVEAVYGDYFNVVGLPLSTVARMLEEIGIEWWRGAAALE